MSQESNSAIVLNKLPDKPIALVGMMGVGKTTIGRRLASELKLPFRDVDAEIVKAAGMPISDYFHLYGEAQFRQGERKVIERLLGEPQHVLATGGGAFVNDETRNMIKENAITVWLRADLDVIVERTSKRDTRPLLQNGNPREILQKLLKERNPFYEQAEIEISSKSGPHMQTVRNILEALRNYEA